MLVCHLLAGLPTSNTYRQSDLMACYSLSGTDYFLMGHQNHINIEMQNCCSAAELARAYRRRHERSGKGDRVRQAKAVLGVE